MNDLDTVYRPELTGRDIDGLVAALDLAVKAGGIQAATVILPLLQKIVAPRRAALAGRPEK